MLKHGMPGRSRRVFRRGTGLGIGGNANAHVRMGSATPYQSNVGRGKNRSFRMYILIMDAI
jgi:hypothetical protein